MVFHGRVWFRSHPLSEWRSYGKISREVDCRFGIVIPQAGVGRWDCPVHLRTRCGVALQRLRPKICMNKSVLLPAGSVSKTVSMQQKKS